MKYQILMKILLAKLKTVFLNTHLFNLSDKTESKFTLIMIKPLNIWINIFNILFKSKIKK